MGQAAHAAQGAAGGDMVALVFDTSLNFTMCILMRQRRGNNGFKSETLNQQHSMGY